MANKIYKVGDYNFYLSDSEAEKLGVKPIKKTDSAAAKPAADAEAAAKAAADAEAAKAKSAKA
jgi:hypothetical protein